MRLMKIELYKLDDHGERKSDCGIVYDTVTAIEIDERGYHIKTLDIYTKEITAFYAPSEKYEIVINRYM